ncbi:MAG: O-antigen ligase family protein [Maribacter sp.]
MRTLLNYINKIGILASLFLFLFLLNPFDLNMLIAYPIVAVTLSKKGFFLRNIDSPFLLLLIFSVIYALFYAFDPIAGGQFIIAYSIFPVGFYLLGKYIYEKLNGNKEKLFYLLFFIGLLYSSTPLISVFLNIIEGGFGQIDRSLPLIWNGSLVSATIMGSYYTLNMCIPAILIVRQKKTNWAFKIAAILVFLLSLACALRIGSRTQILIFIITLFCSLIYIIPRQSLKRNFMTFLIFFLGLYVIISNISFDLDQDWLSTFASRMEKGGSDDIASGGGRSERWVKSIENIFEKPLGWEAKEFGHSHNMWLDVLRVSGIIPFFLLVGFSIKSFFILKSKVLKNKTNLFLNNLLIVYFLALNLVFMVEPIFEGVLELFLLFCLLMGVVVKIEIAKPISQNDVLSE